MAQERWTVFQEKLDATHQWPCLFMYKFIVRPFNLADFKRVFPDESWRTRNSKEGKYVAITMEKWTASSAEVVEIYRRASEIEGILFL